MDEVKRYNLTGKVKQQHMGVLKRHYNNGCPVCNKLLNETNIEFDHWESRERRRVTQTWPLCKGCHKNITYKREARTVISDIHWKRYQLFVAKFLKCKQIGLWD